MAKMHEQKNFEEKKVYEEPEAIMAEVLDVQPRGGEDNKSDEPEEPTPKC